APHLAVGLGHQPARFQVLEVARLVDRGDRAQAHGHGGGLPVLGHQPGVRVGTQALAVHLHAEVVQLLLADAALEERARVDAGRAVALDVQQVAGVVLGRRPPEMVEADVVQGGAGAEGGDVAAELAGLAVGGHHHGHRVPADDRADPPFHRRVAGALGLLAGRDGVDVLGGGREREVGAGAAGDLDHVLQQLVGAGWAVAVEDRLDGFEPLLGLDRIGVFAEELVGLVHGGILARQRWSRPTLQLDPGDLLDVLTRDLISYGRLTLVRHFWNYRIMQTPDALAALSALSHESRLAAFRALVQAGPDGLSVGALRERLDLPAATLTAHLNVLRAAGMVGDEREGRVI